MIFTSPRAASFRGLRLSVLRLQPIRRRGAQPFKGRCNLGTFLSFLSDLCPSALPLCKQQSYRRYRLLPRSVSQYLSVYDSCCMASYFKLRCDGLPHLAIAPAQREKKKQNNRGGHSQKKKRDNNPPLCLQKHPARAQPGSLLPSFLVHADASWFLLLSASARPSTTQSSKCLTKSLHPHPNIN